MNHDGALGKFSRCTIRKPPIKRIMAYRRTCGLHYNSCIRGFEIILKKDLRPSKSPPNMKIFINIHQVILNIIYCLISRHNNYKCIRHKSV